MPFDSALKILGFTSALGGRSFEQYALGAEFCDLRPRPLDLLACDIELRAQFGLANEGKRQLVAVSESRVQRWWLLVTSAPSAEGSNPIGIAAPLASPTSNARNRHRPTVTKRNDTCSTWCTCVESVESVVLHRLQGGRAVLGSLVWSGADGACWRGWSSATDGVAMDQRVCGGRLVWCKNRSLNDRT